MFHLFLQITRFIYSQYHWYPVYYPTINHHTKIKKMRGVKKIQNKKKISEKVGKLVDLVFLGMITTFSCSPENVAGDVLLVS